MKKSYHTENLKQKIIDKIYNMITLEGYQTVTIRKIGENLGVSSAAIYRHFKSLDEALDCVIDICSENFSHKLMDEVYQQTTYQKQLEKAAMNFLNFSLLENYQYDFLFLSPYTIEKSKLEVLENRKLPGIKVFLQLLEEIKAKNNMNFDVDKMFVKLWSFILGYSILINALHQEIDFSIISETIQEIMQAEVI